MLDTITIERMTKHDKQKFITWYNHYLREIAVIIEQSEDKKSYSAYVPDLPGCISAGDMLGECIVNMREALALHIFGILEDNPNEIIPLTDSKEINNDGNLLLFVIPDKNTFDTLLLSVYK